MLFQVHLNGNHLCDAGLNRNGVLTLNLDYSKDGGLCPEEFLAEVTSGSPNTEASMILLGLESEATPGKAVQSVWFHHTITSGDEITIKLLPAGKVSTPEIVTRDVEIEAELGEEINLGTVYEWDPIQWLVRLFTRRVSKK